MSIRRYKGLLRFYEERVKSGDTPYSTLVDIMHYKSHTEASSFIRSTERGRIYFSSSLMKWMAREVYWEMEMIKLRHCE